MDAKKDEVLWTISQVWSGGPQGQVGGGLAENILAALTAAGFTIIKQKG